jgi:hypothetical protein
MRRFLNTLIGKATKSTKRGTSAPRTKRSFLSIESLEEREMLSTTPAVSPVVGFLHPTGTAPTGPMIVPEQLIIYIEELPTAKSATSSNANAGDFLVFFDHVPSHPLLLYYGVNTTPVNTFGNPVTNTTPVNTFGNPVTNTTPVNTFGNPVTNTTPVNTFGNPVTNTTPVNTWGQPVTNTTPVNTFGQPVGNTTLVNTSGKPVTNTTPVNTSGQPVTNTTPVNPFGQLVYNQSVVDTYGRNIIGSMVQVSKPYAPSLPQGVVYPAYLHVNNVMDAAGLSSLLQSAYSSMFVAGPGSGTPYGTLAGPGSGTPYSALTSTQAGQIYTGTVTANFDGQVFQQDVVKWTAGGALVGGAVGAAVGSSAGGVGALPGGGIGLVGGAAVGAIIGTLEGLWDGIFHPQH